MSQITRCPSCATMFKVVADQLRISDGWVRCGHCKQVFDASAHLQPSPPQALMPDLALDKVRPPPQPIPRTEPTVRSWGTLPAQPAVEAPDPTDLRPEAARADEARLADAVAPLPNVLSVPEPVVPAFLAAHVPYPEPVDEAALPPLTLVPETAFPWRTPEPARAEASTSHAALGGSWSASAAGIEWPTIEFTAPPVGYELPAPVLDDADPHDLLDPPLSTDTNEPERSEPEPEPGSQMMGALVAAGAPPFWAQEHPPTEQPVPQEPPAPLEAIEADTAGVETVQAPDQGADLHAQEAFPAPAGGADDEPEGTDAVPEAALGTDEPSFVRAARRKAFWRQPAVRMGLAMLALLLLVALLLQVAVQERNYLAVAVPQVRAPLEALCGPLQCKVGPYRNIASVVVDGSSFQKLKGDEYQFSLTLRNRSDHAVEMPAVELTLTDAQEQPVLRRVLRPEELAAPAELLAQAEWSATVPVQMALVGARITGYRVLAFYP